MPAGECCGSQNELFTTEDQTKKIRFKVQI